MKILKKVWGIGLVIVLLASMLLTATPALAANEGWSMFGTPNPPTSNQILASDVTALTVAPNGDIFVIDSNTPTDLYKSVNGGYYWTKTTVTGATLLDIAVSPNYVNDNMLFVIDTATRRVYQSVNAGLSFAPLGGAFAAGQVPTSIAVAPNFGAGVGEIMVGTWNGAGAVGNVFIWGKDGILDWTPTNIGTTENAIHVIATTNQTGGTAETFTVTYNTTTAVGKTTTVTLPAGMLTGDIVAIPLAAGDTNVIAVTGFATSAGGPVAAAGNTLNIVGSQYGRIFGTNTKGGAPDYVAAAPTMTVGVTSVAFSPSFPIDGTRIAIGSSTVQTVVSTLVGSDVLWDTTLVNTPLLNASTGATIVSTDIAIPSDFNAWLPNSRTLYVSVDGGVDNVYRASVGSATAGAALTPTGITTPQSIAYSGTGLAGKLFVGDKVSTNVSVSSNPSVLNVALITWAANFGAPTGVTNTYVALANDFATSNKVYAGTTGGNSAFSVSDDGGVYFYQTGLIDTAFNSILDLQAASTTEFFLLSEDTGAGDAESLWKSVDGGTMWTRIYSVALTADTGIIRLSPAYATDATIILGDLTATGANAIRMSIDGGKTWTGRSVPIPVGDIAVKDQYTWFIGSSNAAVNGQVQKTTNGGWMWQGVATNSHTAAASVTSIKVDVASGAVLVGLSTGNVAISTDSNTLYKGLGLASGAAGATVVAFDSSYATNNFVYAGNSGAPGAIGIFRCVANATVPAWTAINTTLTAGNCGDIVVSSNGELYAANAAGGGGMARLLEPYMSVTDGARPTSQNITATNVPGAALAGTVTFQNIAVVSGEDSNTIYAIDTTAVAIHTYTDTLINNIPVKTAPAADAIINANNINVVVEPTAGPFATYEVQWNDRADWAGTGNRENFIGFPNFNRILGSSVATVVPNGSTIFYRVRVTAPAFGPWSEVYTVTTELVAPAAPNAPAILSVAGEGGTAAGGWGVSVQPAFYWGPITGATSYEFQLATDTAFSDLVIDATGGNALGLVEAYQYTAGTLNYDTTYFWRVRAISATSQTSWSAVQGFTTMDEVVEPTQTQPTGTATQPTVTTTSVVITQPVTTQVVEETAPAYIWAIIVVGAILVIAVIVLIVRTRRSV